jgi:hypothetical protein
MKKESLEIFLGELDKALVKAFLAQEPISVLGRAYTTLYFESDVDAHVVEDRGAKVARAKNVTRTVRTQ